MRIDALVFSKDRPAQLDLLLRSLAANATHLHGGTVDVLWTASGPRYELGYHELGLELNRAELPFDLHWKREGIGTFRDDVLGWLGDGSRSPVVTLLVDDAVFYRETPPQPFYVYRLGDNVTRCYPQDREQKVPGSRSAVSSWHWDVADGDWGYPLSLDGNVYDRAMLFDLLYDPSPLRFVDPNTLEHGLHLRRARYPLEVLTAPPLSCLVTIPANLVNRTVANRHSADPHETPAELLEVFLDGGRLSLEATFDGVEVTGAHQEIPLRWAA